jgi:cell division protein FtsQ
MNDPKRPSPPPSSVATDVPTAAPTDARTDAASPDPQAGIDTREHSLAELREAARRAQLPDSPPAPAEVDLVEAERREHEDAADDPGDPGEARVVDVDADTAGDAAGAGPIDPRIHERRVAVTRAEGRRRLRVLLVAVALASAIGIAWLIVQSPFLAVKQVNVEGATRHSASEVEAAAAVKDGSALLFVDTDAVARRVEALPWVGEARVERDLPTSLTITVNERLPVAWVRRPVPSGSPEGTLGTIVLVDRSGRVLGEEAQPPVGLPELIGVTRVPDRGDRIEPAAPARAIAQLPDALRSQTASLHRRRGQAVLALAAPPGGAQPAAEEVKLGSFEAIGAKGAAALAILDQLFADRAEVGYIDVRVPGAPATGD